MSHTSTVLAILQTGQRVTIAELNKYLNFEINHPISCICELRKRGHNITDEWVKSATGKRYKVYSLEVE